MLSLLAPARLNVEEKQSVMVRTSVKELSQKRKRCQHDSE